MKPQYKILSIDAWRDGFNKWYWNDWHTIDHIDEIPETNRKILKLLRDLGILTEYSKGKVSIEDDQYNIVICDKNTGMPLIAIEYGNHI